MKVIREKVHILFYHWMSCIIVANEQTDITEKALQQRNDDGRTSTIDRRNKKGEKIAHP